VLAKYAQHPGQLSNSHADALTHIKGRIANIAALCAPGGFFGDRPLMRNLFIWGHARVFCNHAVNVGKPDLARAEYQLIKETLAQYPPVMLDGVPYDEKHEQHLAQTRAARRVAEGGWKARVALALERRPKKPAPGDLALPQPPDNKLRAALYAQQALCYEARENALAAQDSWHAAAFAAGLLAADEAGYRTDRKYGWAAVTA
jgi:hypothetical protein